MAGDRIRDDLVDIALQETFPASDPPAFMATGAPRPSVVQLSGTWPASNRVMPSSGGRRSVKSRDR